MSKKPPEEFHDFALRNLTERIKDDKRIPYLADLITDYNFEPLPKEAFTNQEKAEKILKNSTCLIPFIFKPQFPHNINVHHIAVRNIQDVHAKDKAIALTGYSPSYPIWFLAHDKNMPEDNEKMKKIRLRSHRFNRIDPNEILFSFTLPEYAHNQIKITEKKISIEEIEEIDVKDVQETKLYPREYENFLLSLENVPDIYMKFDYRTHIMNSIKKVIECNITPDYKSLRSLARKIKEKKNEGRVINNYEREPMMDITYSEGRLYVKDATRFKVLVRQAPEIKKQDSGYSIFDYSLRYVWKAAEEIYNMLKDKKFGLDSEIEYCSDIIFSPSRLGAMFFIFKVYDRDLGYTYEIMITTDTQWNNMKEDGYHKRRLELAPSFNDIKELLQNIKV